MIQLYYLLILCMKSFGRLLLSLLLGGLFLISSGWAAITGTVQTSDWSIAQWAVIHIESSSWENIIRSTDLDWKFNINTNISSWTIRADFAWSSSATTTFNNQDIWLITIEGNALAEIIIPTCTSWKIGIYNESNWDFIRCEEKLECLYNEEHIEIDTFFEWELIVIGQECLWEDEEIETNSQSSCEAQSNYFWDAASGECIWETVDESLICDEPGATKDDDGSCYCPDWSTWASGVCIFKACSDTNTIWKDKENACSCKQHINPKDNTSACLTPADGAFGIECDERQLTTGTCKRRIYDTINIRQDNTSTAAEPFIQDIVLSATSFVGTVLILAMIVSAIMIIMGWANESMASKWRQGLKMALIGFVIVSMSYVVIRLIQYIAKG